MTFYLFFDVLAPATSYISLGVIPPTMHKLDTPFATECNMRYTQKMKPAALKKMYNKLVSELHERGDYGFVEVQNPSWNSCKSLQKRHDALNDFEGLPDNFVKVDSHYYGELPEHPFYEVIALLNDPFEAYTGV